MKVTTQRNWCYVSMDTTIIAIAATAYRKNNLEIVTKTPKSRKSGDFRATESEEFANTFNLMRL